MRETRSEDQQRAAGMINQSTGDDATCYLFHFLAVRSQPSFELRPFLSQDVQCVLESGLHLVCLLLCSGGRVSHRKKPKRHGHTRCEQGREGRSKTSPAACFIDNSSLVPSSSCLETARSSAWIWCSCSSLSNFLLWMEIPPLT